MLPRRLRLTRADFAVLRGRRVAAPHFSIAFAPAQGVGKCAVIVSKKVAAKSADRHLLKRRVLGVLHSFCGRGVDIVVTARAGASSLPFGILKAELTHALHSLPLS